MSNASLPHPGLWPNPYVSGQSQGVDGTTIQEKNESTLIIRLSENDKKKDVSLQRKETEK